MTPPERQAFKLAALATVLAGMADHARAHQLTETAMLLSLQAEVLRTAPELDPADKALLLASLGTATLGGWHIATSTHQPDPQGHRAGFFRGVAGFSVSQLATLALLRRRGAGLHAGNWPLRAAAAGLGLALIAARDPHSLPALGGYGALLSGMALLAGDPKLGSPKLRQGGWLFVASDLLILVRRYLLTGRTERALAEGLMLALYAGAQRQLVDGLLDASRRDATAP